MDDTDAVTERLESLLTSRRGLPAPEERRRIRAAAGISASELAVCLEVSRQAVAQWERGERTPRGVHLRNYVAALNMLSEESA